MAASLVEDIREDYQKVRWDYMLSLAWISQSNVLASILENYIKSSCENYLPVATRIVEEMADYSPSLDSRVIIAIDCLEQRLHSSNSGLAGLALERIKCARMHLTDREEAPPYIRYLRVLSDVVTAETVTQIGCEVNFRVPIGIETRIMIDGMYSALKIEVE